MTTHLTDHQHHAEDDATAHGFSPDDEEPELVLLDDDEFEAAHRDDYLDEADEDLFLADDSDFVLAFAEEADERGSTGGGGADDDRMETLFHAMDDEPAVEAEPVDASVEVPFEPLLLPRRAAAAGAVAGGTVGQPIPVPRSERVKPSKRELKAAERRAKEEQERQRAEARRTQAAAKQRQREEKKQAQEDARQAAATRKEEYAAAKRDAAEAKKRAAAEAKQQADQAKQEKAASKKSKKRRDDIAPAASALTTLAAMDAAAPVAAAASGLTLLEPARHSPDPDEAAGHGATGVQAPAGSGDGGATRKVLVAVAVVVLVLAGIGVYAKTRPRAVPPAPARAAGSTLPSALAATVGAKTAVVTYVLGMQGAQPTTIDGNGTVALGSQGGSLSLTYKGNGYTFPEQIVFDGGRAFYNLGDILRYIAPGYTWVSLDLATVGTGNPGVGVGGVLADPSALVSLVQASSAAAKRVGTTQFGGVQMTEYSLSLDAEQAAQVAASASLPTFVRSELGLVPYTDLDATVLVDGAGQVAQIQASGIFVQAGQPVAVHTTLGLSGFGTPVSVAVPSSAKVVSVQQFEANAQRLAHASRS